MPLDIFVGHKFGMLTVKSFEQRQEKGQKRWYALCQCDCGKEKWIAWHSVKSGLSTSCGCWVVVAVAASSRARKEKWYKTRGEEVAAFYVKNPHLTLADVGRVYGISRERARQVVDFYYPSDKSAKEVHAERKQRVAEIVEERETLLSENERLRAELQAARG